MAENQTIILKYSATAGSNGSVLVADSTAATGYTWTNVIRGGAF